MDDNGDILRTIVPPLGATDRTRLGEELPIFCERCGYSLHGLQQNRCEACNVLHFACPECGHHQPINTLRPAFQRLLGRMRAGGLVLIMLFKVNFFFWALFAWAAFGAELAYVYRWYGNGRSEYGTATYEFEVVVAVFLFGAAFGASGRMLLLRWNRGVLVGLTLGILVVVAMIIGAHLEQFWRSGRIPSPITVDFCMYLFWVIVGAALGGWIVWGIWVALVQLFLPKRAGLALLEWQRAMSAKLNEPVRTDTTTSVTV
jgi:hypothetical protein